MNKYRINVRFDLDKPKEANAAQYLQALDKSRNAFMRTAVLNEMQRQTSASSFLLEDIRQVIREELQEVSLVQRNFDRITVDFFYAKKPLEIGLFGCCRI